MNFEKQNAKLLKLQAKADACTSRKEAIKILKKSEKALHKLSRPQTTAQLYVGLNRRIKGVGVLISYKKSDVEPPLPFTELKV